jgi:hypothetical protein
MYIDMRYDGVDLCAGGPLWLGTAVQPTGSIGSSRRIGLTGKSIASVDFLNATAYLSAGRGLSFT